MSALSEVGHGAQIVWKETRLAPGVIVVEGSARGLYNQLYPSKEYVTTIADDKRERIIKLLQEYNKEQNKMGIHDINKYSSHGYFAKWADRFLEILK